MFKVQCLVGPREQIRRKQDHERLKSNLLVSCYNVAWMTPKSAGRDVPTPPHTRSHRCQWFNWYGQTLHLLKVQTIKPSQLTECIFREVFAWRLHPHVRPVHRFKSCINVRTTLKMSSTTMAEQFLQSILIQLVRVNTAWASTTDFLLWTVLWRLVSSFISLDID